MSAGSAALVATDIINGNHNITNINIDFMQASLERLTK
jgi:hypothetical protein